MADRKPGGFITSIPSIPSIPFCPLPSSDKALRCYLGAIIEPDYTTYQIELDTLKSRIESLIAFLNKREVQSFYIKGRGARPCAPTYVPHTCA